METMEGDLMSLPIAGLIGDRGGEVIFSPGGLFHRTSAVDENWGKCFKCCSKAAFSWVFKPLPRSTNNSSESESENEKCPACPGQDAEHVGHPPFTVDDLRLLQSKHDVRLRVSCLTLGKKERIPASLVRRWMDESLERSHGFLPDSTLIRQLNKANKKSLQRMISRCTYRDHRGRRTVGRELFKAGKKSYKIPVPKFTLKDVDGPMEEFALSWAEENFKTAQNLFNCIIDPSQFDIDPEDIQFFEEEHVRLGMLRQRTELVREQRRDRRIASLDRMELTEQHPSTSSPGSRSPAPTTMPPLNPAPVTTPVLSSATPPPRPPRTRGGQLGLQGKFLEKFKIN